MTPSRLAERACLLNVMTFSNLDSAIIGLVDQPGKTPVAIYSQTKIMKCLRTRLSEQEASDYFWRNVYPVYNGDKTPIIVMDE